MVSSPMCNRKVSPAFSMTSYGPLTSDSSFWFLPILVASKVILISLFRFNALGMDLAIIVTLMPCLGFAQVLISA
jgi:hypothetical protein